MPTYGYQCTQCGHEFQVFQKMSDDPIRVCPTCSGEVKRLLYPVGIVFKGSGWYVNDSRAPEKSEGDSADKGEKTTETKPAETKSSETTSTESKPTESSTKPEASPSKP